MSASFTIRKLLFVGDGVENSWLNFEAGLNIVYGGSNAGKSFTLRALDFMLGSDRLRLPKQGARYHTIFLWMDLPDGSSITLQRAVKGGSFKLYESHITPEESLSLDGEVLAPNQKGRGKGKSKNDSISEYLLRQIGVKSSALLVRNELGQKNQFSIRMLSHYLLVGEDDIIGERSPIQIPGQRMSALDKSLFRYMLTGRDDSEIIEVPKGDKLSASRGGKIEILSELIEKIEPEIGSDADLEELKKQLSKVKSYIESVYGTLAESQSGLDGLQLRRRALLESKANNEYKLAELAVMLSRFQELKSVYESDIDRLAALEEGGFLVQRFSDLPCPLCGADVDHQHISVGMDEVETQRAAADVEISKINRDLSDLKSTIASLEAEVLGLTRRLPAIEQEALTLDAEINLIRPQEVDVRKRYEDAIVIKSEIERKLSLIQQKVELEQKILDLSELKFGRQRADGLSVEVNASTAFAFSKTMKGVLESWRFPDIGEVHFDPKTQDVVVNGRERADNGKGIRAILHSAFKVAVLIFCRENSLPHPGFVVLDSPLLTYRGPLLFEKYGELAADEKLVKKTTLNKFFYEHLAGIASLGQIIVLENQDPPSEIFSLANVVMFSGENGSGREGFFPPLDGVTVGATS